MSKAFPELNPSNAQTGHSDIHTRVIPVLGIQRQEDQKLVVTLRYMASLKPAGDIYEILSQTERDGKEENKMKRMPNTKMHSLGENKHWKHTERTFTNSKT